MGYYLYVLVTFSRTLTELMWHKNYFSPWY